MIPTSRKKQSLFNEGGLVWKALQSLIAFHEKGRHHKKARCKTPGLRCAFFHDYEKESSICLILNVRFQFIQNVQENLGQKSVIFLAIRYKNPYNKVSDNAYIQVNAGSAQRLQKTEGFPMADLQDETLRRAQELAHFQLLASGDIPKIDLYMEQVISLLEQEMGASLRRREESVFTNTMINNYSKEGVLPRPENKRYNRRHIITLIYIFLLKQNLPMPEIKRFTSHIENAEQLDKMYAVFYDLVGSYEQSYQKEIADKLSQIERQCEEQGMTDEISTALTLIALLSFEASLNTMLSSRLLDYCQEKKAERLQQEAEAAKAREQAENGQA